MNADRPPQPLREFVNIDRGEEDFSTESRTILSRDRERAIMTTAHKLILRATQHYRIGVVCALPKEFAAVRSMLDNDDDYPVEGDPHQYCVGTVPCAVAPQGDSHHVVCSLVPKMGNNSAASTAANLLRSFPSVRDVLMVGIAGGVPAPESAEDHVRLGDVVVSRDRGVVQYDMQKVERGKVSIRDTSSPPSAMMTNVVRALEAGRIRGERPWEQHVSRAATLEDSARPPDETDVLHDPVNPDRVIEHPVDPKIRPGMPKVHYGLIGSANVLLKKPSLREYLRKKHKVCAIEMEGSGIADGTWTHGAEYLLIRGVCDYCDGYKNDMWQGYAAVAAAAYARALIERTPLRAAQGL